MSKLTNGLLRRAHRAAVKHAELSARITEAFEERYGTTHSAIDCDDIIECLDYGHGHEMTVADCDEAMARSGTPTLLAKIGEGQ
jgi:hypothetical protein